MKCLFCHQKMYLEEYTIGDTSLKYHCSSIKCMVNNDFTRYICILDEDYKLCHQEYAFGGFYVKVNKNGTLIYKLNSCILLDEVKVPQSLWLKPSNYKQRLDKMAGLHYILSV